MFTTTLYAIMFSLSSLALILASRYQSSAIAEVADIVTGLVLIVHIIACIALFGLHHILNRATLNSNYPSKCARYIAKAQTRDCHINFNHVYVGLMCFSLILVDSIMNASALAVVYTASYMVYTHINYSNNHTPTGNNHAR